MNVVGDSSQNANIYEQNNMQKCFFLSSSQLDDNELFSFVSIFEKIKYVQNVGEKGQKSGNLCVEYNKE